MTSEAVAYELEKMDEAEKTAPGDYMLSMDLQDGFYAVVIAPEDRDYFPVNYRGKLYRLAGLPMGCS
eukprot:jgi/Tetstr1/427499/TSEL_017625.t1